MTKIRLKTVSRKVVRHFFFLLYYVRRKLPRRNLICVQESVTGEGGVVSPMTGYQFMTVLLKKYEAAVFSCFIPGYWLKSYKYRLTNMN
jgi:hypothetical protein